MALCDLAQDEANTVLQIRFHIRLNAWAADFWT